MIILKKFLVERDSEGKISCNRSTLERLDTLIGFTLKAGIYKTHLLTGTLSEMMRYVSDGAGNLELQVYDFEYDDERGILVGDGFFRQERMFTRGELEKEYTLLTVEIGKGVIFEKIQGLYVRISGCNMQYLLDNYNGTYETKEIPLKVVQSIKDGLYSGYLSYDREGSLKNINMYDNVDWKVILRKYASKSMGEYGFRYVENYPVHVDENGRIRIEIIENDNNFSSLTLNEESIKFILSLMK